MNKAPPLSPVDPATADNRAISNVLWTWLQNVRGIAERGGLTAGDLRPVRAAAATPRGYLECDGRSVSKTGYRTLYGVIGGTYGEATDTFNVPTITQTGVKWLIKT